MDTLPACGLYRTTRPLGESVPADSLVYFHNHGEPGPGVYLPSGWTDNRATFHEKGTSLVDLSWAGTLEPLAAEGLYRVVEPFTCCEKQCRAFESDLLVQLGYDGAARPLLFVPQWTADGLRFPKAGAPLAANRLASLKPVKVANAPDAGSSLH